MVSVLTVPLLYFMQLTYIVTVRGRCVSVQLAVMCFNGAFTVLIPGNVSSV